MYGFNIDNLGAVSGDYTAFTLLDHGYARLVPSKHPFSIFFPNTWKFDIPKVGNDAKYLVFFLTTENSRIFIADEGECVAFIGMSRPYVYVYSNVVQKGREEYGMEVFNKDGKLIYNSSSKPLKILKSANFNEINNTRFYRDTAVSIMGSMCHFGPVPDYVKAFFSRVSKSDGLISLSSEETGTSTPYPAGVASQLRQMFGFSVQGGNPLFTVIDVSDIKRKE